MAEPIIFWVLFIAGLFILLAIDLRWSGHRLHPMTISESLLWTSFYVGVALAFNLVIYFWRGSTPALEFFTGYLLEESLSVDNLFVFLLIFTFFAVPADHQHRVLFWGILGALIMRGLFIIAGVALIQKLHWIIYLFGAFLVFTGVRLGKTQDKKIEPEKNPVLRLMRRWLPVAPEYDGGKFFTKLDGKRCATPLFIVLVTVETTDLVFAIDSIPAVMSITLDPFIVFTSNMLAIMGLRSLYFALRGAMSMFRFLSKGLAVILSFTGIKMLLADIFHIPTAIALGVIIVTLAISIAASLLIKPVESEKK